jgi:CYTH domain-containing protein
MKKLILAIFVILSLGTLAEDSLPTMKEEPISKSQFDRYSKYSTLRIEKDRFAVEKYEIDYYDNALCVVEVEFKNIFQAIFFKKPEWFGRELTFNKRFKNIELAKGCLN